MLALAKEVLRLMDAYEDPSYSKSLNTVVKKYGADKSALELELNRYI